MGTWKIALMKMYSVLSLPYLDMLTLCNSTLTNPKYDIQHKSRLVADGHLTEVPLDSIYSGVVSLWWIMPSCLPFQAQWSWCLGHRHWQCLSWGRNLRKGLHYCRSWIWWVGRTHPHHLQGTLWPQDFWPPLAWALCQLPKGHGFPSMQGWTW